ncbi:MAG: DNA repair protein RadC [Bacilli bacterium]|nr:DNA repair protein RadC [Bacilli bacterium]
MVKIKELPTHDRPIERLLNNGVESLSDEELIAIILKTGSKNISSKELSSFILSKTKGLKNLADLNYEQLTKIKGIGKIKATTIIALLEISKRINTKSNNIYNTKFNNTKIVFEYYKEKIGNKKQEYFYCLYLDNNKRIIKDKLLYIGTINMTVVHPREVFKEAYLLSASSIICIHNHPSGNILPSNNDIDLTKNLIAISKIMGINIIDHIIIGIDKYYSFFENNKV